MGTVLYFIALGGLFLLMMRFGCGAHVMGHGHGGHEEHGEHAGEGGAARWVQPETDIDPVCRMSIRTEGAKSSVYRGSVYYFCSVEHRDTFEANPEQYVGAAVLGVVKPMEHNRV